MKTKRTLKKVLAVVLCISMTLCLIPAGANAADNTTEQATEVVSLREENVKHFDMGNGSYQAIAYSHPVHEMDSGGNWQDIDFSMNLTQAKGVRAYTNSAGAAFAANYTANQPLMTLSGDGTSIVMSLLQNTNTATMSTQAMASTATVAAELTATQTRIQTFEDAQAASFSNTLLYENVMPSIDLEYIVDPWTVKENIIVNQPASKYEYCFKLDLNGLYPVLQEDGSIHIYSNETDEKEYLIPAPYMYDAIGEMSFNVSYTLAGSNGIYYLTVTADEEWINESDRSFPVVIDPTVNTETNTVSMDTYITGDLPNDIRGGYQFFFVGENEVAYVYLPIQELPVQAVIEDATLSTYYFYKDHVTSGFVDVEAYEVDNMYWAQESLTWNSVVDNYSNFGLGSTQLGNTKRTYGNNGAYSQSPKKVEFNIKTAVQSWVSQASENCGIGLRRAYSSTNKSVMFRSREGLASYRPQISYTYRIVGESYYKALQSIYGFSKEDAILIMKLYARVDNAFSGNSPVENAWIASRLLGGLVYGDYSSEEIDKIKWRDTAGMLFPSDAATTERSYYTETLNCTQNEYSKLRTLVRRQHEDAQKDNVGDFAHMQISLASRLSCYLNYDGPWANIIFGEDAIISFLAGWLGDAVIVNNGTTSFKNDDYIADLDAENIFQQIINDNSILVASHLYFQELNSNTRADIFTEYVSYAYAKERICIALLADENADILELSVDFPDTYNFLCSIRDGLNEIGNYLS